jgi:hypothetical protein
MYPNLSADRMVADADFSPTKDYFDWQNPFDQAHSDGLYTIPPDHSLEVFVDYAYFELPETSVKYSTGLDYCLADYPIPPPGESEQSCASILDTVSAFNLDTPTTPNTGLYSALPTSREGITALVSPPLPPPLPACEITKEATSLDEDLAPQQARRKRGRPRLDRNLLGAKSIPSSNIQSPKQRQREPRQPHNQVERKYREGLNSDLERLRRAIPTLSQSEDDAIIGRPKPSKAMVLSCAVEYIAKIESERDGLRKGNEVLGGTLWRNQ